MIFGQVRQVQVSCHFKNSMVGSSLGTVIRDREMAKKRVARKIKAEGVLSWIGTQARRPDGRDARTAHAARPKAAG